MLPGPAVFYDDITLDSGKIAGIAQGWYVYAGSAGKNLSRRIARHLRKKRKKKHWHIDYLTPAAKTIRAFPVKSLENLECRLAGDLEGIGGKGVPGFGCSDCRCESHLFYFPFPPEERREFQELLCRYRHREFFRQVNSI